MFYCFYLSVLKAAVIGVLVLPLSLARWWFGFVLDLRSFLQHNVQHNMPPPTLIHTQKQDRS